MFKVKSLTTKISDNFYGFLLRMETSQFIIRFIMLMMLRKLFAWFLNISMVIMIGFMSALLKVVLAVYMMLR